MSLLKRKPSSLDPAQKQRKFRQCEYYALLDKCLQIPNDDKLILRKYVEEEEERLISLLEKYRKQASKDLKDLQIYLRKYIQKHKQQHPKYPTLKMTRSPEHCYTMHKRNSFSFSINTSKVTIDMASSSSQMKQSFCVPAKKQVPMLQVKKHQKAALRLNSHMDSRDEEKNYEELIRKRKTEKLKISQHKVSVTIQNESHSTSFYQDQFKEKKSPEKQSIFCASPNHFPMSPKIEASMVASKFDQAQIFKPIDQKQEKCEFLQTMRFRMRIDEPQEQKQPQAKPKNQIQNSNIPLITTDQSVFQTQFDQRIPTKQDNAQIYPEVKKKLFSNEFLMSPKIYGNQAQLIKSNRNSRVRNPLEEINFDNTFCSVNKFKDMNSNRLPLQSSKKIPYQNVLNSLQNFPLKEKFNSGHKKSQDSILHELFSKTDDYESLIQSHFRQQSKVNPYSVSRINKENDENQIQSQYIKSQRKLSDLYSHRLLEENNRSFINSFCKDKDEKDNKSSRMIFSHRMQEVISGRKHENQNPKSSEKASLVNPSYSFREKKGANKLEFWARIQSTINQ